MKKSVLYSVISGILLFILAAVFSLSLLLVLLDFGAMSPATNSFFYKCGKILVGVYGICSICIPVFFIVAGIQCFMTKWRVKNGVLLVGSIVPFFTLDAVEHVCKMFIASDTGGVLVVKTVSTLLIGVLLLALEYLLLLVIGNLLESVYERKTYDEIAGTEDDDVIYPFAEDDDHSYNAETINKNYEEASSEQLQAEPSAEEAAHIQEGDSLQDEEDFEDEGIEENSDNTEKEEFLDEDDFDVEVVDSPDVDSGVEETFVELDEEDVDFEDNDENQGELPVVSNEHRRAAVLKSIHDDETNPFAHIFDAVEKKDKAALEALEKKQEEKKIARMQLASEPVLEPDQNIDVTELSVEEAEKLAENGVNLEDIAQKAVSSIKEEQPAEQIKAPDENPAAEESVPEVAEEASVTEEDTDSLASDFKDDDSLDESFAEEFDEDIDDSAYVDFVSEDDEVADFDDDFYDIDMDAEGIPVEDKPAEEEPITTVQDSAEPVETEETPAQEEAPVTNTEVEANRSKELDDVFNRMKEDAAENPVLREHGYFKNPENEIPESVGEPVLGDDSEEPLMEQVTEPEEPEISTEDSELEEDETYIDDNDSTEEEPTDEFAAAAEDDDVDTDESEQMQEAPVEIESSDQFESEDDEDSDFDEDEEDEVPDVSAAFDDTEIIEEEELSDEFSDEDADSSADSRIEDSQFANSKFANYQFDPTAKPVVDANGTPYADDEDDDEAEDDDFDESEQDEEISEQSQEIVSSETHTEPVRRGPYKIPTEGLLNSYPDGNYWIIDDETRHAGDELKQTLNEFRIEAEITGICKGPVVTMFEILPAPGVKLSRIVALQDNIALRLAASSVRIVAPIPGKHAVGIEVPNRERSIVSFKEIIDAELPAFDKMAVPVILGKDISGEPKLIDLAKTPHLLIAGSTGAGKSVCVNTMLLSILYKRSPQQVKLVLIDPKIVELKLYNDIPHLLTPVITEPKKALQALQYCLCEMERRYALLDGMSVRDIISYNKRIQERHIATEKLPYIVVVIDEFADLMATTGKELEQTIARLAAMSRAVGIHLVLATQRPSIDVITGLIKANIPSRIAFMVASKMDSRIIIDQTGAEKLLGKGDMLYASATDPFPTRIQGTLVSDNEVENVVEYVKTFGEPDYIDDEIFVDEDEEEEGSGNMFNEGEDPLYDQALQIVLQAGKASASYLQRRLKIGYNRAARLVEEMEERGIVGPANGAKPREIIHMP